MTKDVFGIDKRQMDRLAEPFLPEELEFRALRWNKDNTSALAFAYVSARAVQDRLDEVFGGEWSFDAQVIPVAESCGEAVVIGKLTINGVTRTDIGEADVLSKKDGNGTVNEPWKAAVSDSLKRAAVQFGVGRYLYRLPQVWFGWEGAREYGNFTENPATRLFNEDGTLKDGVQSKDTKPSRTAGKSGGKAATPARGKAEEEEKPAPKSKASAPAPKGKAAPAPKAGKSNANDDVLQEQIDWLNNYVYEPNGEELPEDVNSWTRKEASEHIRECLAAGGGNPPTVAQIDLLSKLYAQLGQEIPYDLVDMSGKDASDTIKELIEEAKSSR